MSVKFHIHTDNHEEVENQLKESESDFNWEQTDLGYKGISKDSESCKDSILELCDSVSQHMVSVVLVSISEDGLANGIGYQYRDSRRITDRQSQGNDPETWHGIVYDGMHLNAEGLV